MRWGIFFLSLGVALYVSCQKSAISSPDSPHYVGDSACQSCHADIVKAYQATWKAHSLVPITSQLERIENFAQSAVYDKHTNFYYRAVWEGDSLFLYEYRLQGKDTTYLRRERLDFVIGSGHQTRSYLLWRNGFLYEAPLTWYVQPQKWDLSPGYADGKNSRFSREIQPPCLSCHASGWEAIPWTYNQYRQIGGAIGCESCHGPGSSHIQNPQDTSYWWSRWTPAQQMDVCSRCHLEGIAVEKQAGWKPKESLSKYWAIFLPERAELGQFGIASHAERLLRSACFQKGKATCTTCHNPHPTQTVLSYENRCLSCHRTGCKNPNHASTGCVGCHMPKGKSSDIPHTRFTDHYIRVVNAAKIDSPKHPKLICATEKNPDSTLIAHAYLKWYSEDKPEPWVLEYALSYLPKNKAPEIQARAYLLAGDYRQALPLAVQALQTDTTLNLLEMYAYLLELTGQVDRALNAWAELKRRAPAYPEAQFRYILLAFQSGKLSPQSAYEEMVSLTRIQPWNAQFHYNAAVLAGILGRRTNAKLHLQSALAYEPDYQAAIEALRRLP
ncbi:MAG: tetratricopeptide repeat protein [Bacteroidia bacterium]|nr:tetratricopeptide repeat protein [Bacteroidia bacterium]MCX7651891.1 tetratricopeptide repeat protein [Bacteroidia bacterium]MDW8416042.1 tetratricopeptide repeat protein [Bacteroidia bacterium]